MKMLAFISYEPSQSAPFPRNLVYIPFTCFVIHNTLTLKRNTYFGKSPVLARTVILTMTLSICINFSMFNKPQAEFSIMLAPHIISKQLDVRGTWKH